jgi:lipid II:glycine glycyltransferase (peptidoglycan interpeptide bridge formation enzyme)
LHVRNSDPLLENFQNKFKKFDKYILKTYINTMEKTITIKLSDKEHKKFVEICNKTGKRRSFFVKEAIMDRINEYSEDTK